MNEEKMERLIREYGESMPDFTGRSRHAARFPRRALALCMTLSIAGVMVAALMSRAEARVGKEMENALENVRTLYAKTWVRHGSARRPMFLNETWLANGVWVVEGSKGSPLHDRWLFTSGEQYQDDMVRKVSTVEPRVAQFYAKTALDFVIEQMHMSPTEPGTTKTRVVGPVTAGRKTYKLVFFRSPRHAPQVKSRTVILVDEASNLPLWSESVNQFPGKRDTFVRSEYLFDKPVDPKILKPRFSPVIDLAAAQRRRMAAWKGKPLAKTDSTDVYDVQVNEEGAVFVLFEGKGVPTSVMGEDGSSYLLAMDYRPGGTYRDTGTQKRCGETRGSIFVPISRKAPRTIRFRVKMGSRPFTNPGEGTTRTASAGIAGEWVGLTAKRCEKWPDYEFDLMLAKLFLGSDPEMAATQAKYLERKGDVDGAVERYRLAYRRMQGFVGRVAHRYLAPSEKLLRSKGRTAEADELARVIAADRAVDPNEPEPRKRP